MAEIGRWNGHIFEVSASIVRGFSALTIKAGCETEDKTSNKQKYVKRKAGNAAQVTMTITLLSALGCDVRREVETFLEEARAGKKDYFYIGNSKLLPEKLMLTDANADSIEISPSGFWSAATLKLTMKQAEKGEESSASSSGSSKSGSSKSGSSKSGSSSGSKKESVKSDYYNMKASQIAANNNSKYSSSSTDNAIEAANKVVEKAKTESKESLKVKDYYVTSTGKKIPIMSV